MKILLVTNMYPCVDSPYYGIFVKEQECAITRRHPDVEYQVYFIDGRTNKLAYLKSIFEIIRIIKRQKFDLIHIHYGFSGLFLLFKHFIRVPVLVTLHGGDIQAEQGKKIQVYLTKKILKRANAAITLNERMDNIVRRYIDKTYLVPCSVDTDLFQPKSAIGHLKKEYVDLVFPSDSMRYVKNYPLFQKTVTILKEKYGIPCRIHQVKNMSRKQVASLYKESDLMLMTSISEGSPQVVKEAMSCNLPVISTNVGDVAHLLKNVKNSKVSKTMEADELAELCEAALNHRIEGINGREKLIEMHLDDNSVSDTIYKIYKSIIVKES